LVGRDAGKKEVIFSRILSSPVGQGFEFLLQNETDKFVSWLSEENLFLVWICKLKNKELKRSPHVVVTNAQTSPLFRKHRQDDACHKPKGKTRRGEVRQQFLSMFANMGAWTEAISNCGLL
jgi:hypothetical protein